MPIETLMDIVSFFKKVMHAANCHFSSGGWCWQTPVLIGVEVLQPLHPLSNACSFKLSIWLPISLEACFEIFFPDSYPDILHHNLNLPFFLFPCHEVCDHQQEVNFDSFQSLELLELFANTGSMTLEISFPPERKKLHLSISHSLHSFLQSNLEQPPSKSIKVKGDGEMGVKLLNNCHQLKD